MLIATAAGLRSEAWILQHNLENGLWYMDWARQQVYELHAARSEWLIRQPEYVDLTFGVEQMADFHRECQMGGRRSLEQLFEEFKRVCCLPTPTGQLKASPQKSSCNIFVIPVCTPASQTKKCSRQEDCPALSTSLSCALSRDFGGARVREDTMLVLHCTHIRCIAGLAKSIVPNLLNAWIAWSNPVQTHFVA